MLRIKLLAVFVFSFIVFSNAQTIVKGTLVGYNGKPMVNASVALKQPLDITVIKSAAADKDGKFKIEVDSSGIWILYFTGVDHEPYQMALYVDKSSTVNVNVRLKTYGYLNDFSNAKVLGNFNGWLDSTAVPMTKNADGTYSAEVDSRSDTVIYRLQNVAKEDLVEGTQADAYAFNDYQGYNSLIFSKPGKVKITFDPNKLVTSSNPQEVKFARPSSFAARFAEVYDEIVNNRSVFTKAVKEFQASGQDLKTFKYDWTKEVDNFASQIHAEKNNIVRDELMFGYLELANMRANLDTNIVKQAMVYLTPSSVIWSLNPIVVQAGLYLSRAGKEKVDEFLTQAAGENKSITVRTDMLYLLFTRAKFMNKPDEASKYYNILVTQYGNTEVGKMVKERFSNVVHVKVGSPMPSFSFVSLDDSSKVVTNESLKGKNYLMDFWATWCGPCVGQMQTLNDAYEKYKGKNFEMISVSFDRSAGDVTKFRSEQWKMPWFNSFVDPNTQQKILKDFDIIGIPNPILVNDKGIVVAVQGDLESESLDKTLNELLGK